MCAAITSSLEPIKRFDLFSWRLVQFVPVVRVGIRSLERICSKFILLSFDTTRVIVSFDLLVP